MSANGGLLRRIPDRPLTPAVVALVLATLFVLVRVYSVGDGDIGSFVAAGDILSSGTSLPLREGAGYDGQFYFRMATVPLNFDATAAGVILDSELRLQRIGYPALAWLVSLGGLLSVTVALVAVNVLGLAVIAGVGGVYSQRFGRHALWGLTLALFYGFAFTLSNDLTEIVEVAFLLLGLLAAHQQRFVLAALALGGAVLTRESAIVVALAIAAWRLYSFVRHRQRPSAIDLTWIVPSLMFALWQLIVRVGTGRFPILIARNYPLRPPGAPLIRALPVLLDDLSARGIIHLAEVVVLVAVLLFALVSVRKSAAAPLEIVVFVALAIACLSIDTSEKIWITRSVRHFADAYALAMLILLSACRRLRYAVTAVGAVTATTYGYFIFNL